VKNNPLLRGGIVAPAPPPGVLKGYRDEDF